MTASPRPRLSADDPVHGTKTGYTKGCRDECCRTAQAQAQARWRTRSIIYGPTELVDATGTRRRIHALMALGHSTPRIGTACALDESTIRTLATRQRITPRSAQRIARVYDELSMTVGTSTKTRRYAARMGWAPPLAWDDIDDPRERPSGVRRPSHSGPGHDDVDESVVDRILAGDWRLSATRAERRAVVARWLAAGRGPLNDLERRTGWRFDRYLEQDEQEAS